MKSTNKMQQIGDRMKGYEQTAQTHLPKKIPVILRVDGVCFHTYTKNTKKPFDGRLTGAMDVATQKLMSSIQGCKAAYTQSDEATFLITDFDRIETQAWRDYNVSKMVSVAASQMTMAFNWAISNMGHELEESHLPPEATFDARVFSIPKEDVANVFLWRYLDCIRNSVQSKAHSVFTHKVLQGKSVKDMLEMLEGAGESWEETCSPRETHGRFYTKEGRELLGVSTERNTYEGWAEPLERFLYPEKSA